MARRATFAVSQLVEVVVENCRRQGPIVIQASFDEFNFDIRVDYEGEKLDFPERRPSDAQNRASEEGMRLLAGYMLRRNADWVRSERQNDNVTIHFHFDH